MSGMKERLAQLGVELEQLQGEEKILTAAENGNWTEVLHLAKHLGHPMNRGAANLYLEYALQDAPCKEFNQILSWVPKGEYTGTVVVQRTTEYCYGAEVTGTLVTLAAAQGKTEQLKSLLSHG